MAVDHAAPGGVALGPVLELDRCNRCTIRHQAFCSALSEVELQRLNQISRPRRIAPGQMVMSEEERSSFFANVVAGVVKLSKTLSDGRQQIVGLLFPPDFLGRTFVREYPCFAAAASEVELCCFPRDGFERMLREFPGLEHRLFERTLDELDSARDWMLLLGRKTAEEKVASFLLMLAKRSPSVICAHSRRSDAAMLELPLTRADIGDYLGLTIETVSRQLTRLKTRRIIRLISNRFIQVHDLGQLAAIAGQDPASH
jgi:CRP/FNR family transcriptional regulator